MANEQMGAQAQEKVFNVLIEKDEDGYYVGSVVELPGCHTQAKTLDQLNRRIREAIEGYLQVSSRGFRPEFVGVQQLKIKFPIPPSEPEIDSPFDKVRTYFQRFPEKKIFNVS